MKTAFVFSGQGSQTVGMGQTLYNNFPSVRQIYNTASKAIGRSVSNMCFNTTPEILGKTVNSQPALFTLSMAGLQLLQENNIKCDAVAGFSLGECTALCGAGILDINSALNLILLRGDAMQKASEQTNGDMYAIIGVNVEEVIEVCNKVDGYVVPVNFNCPGQTVIAGDRISTKKAADMLKDIGAIKTVHLNVSGAFHSKFMESAANEFVTSIKNFEFNTPKMDFYSDVYGNKITDFSNMPEYLGKQMTNPVLWQQIIENMIADGIELFIELGAGRVLSGLIKRISRTAKICNIEDIQSFEKTLETVESLK